MKNVIALIIFSLMGCAKPITVNPEMDEQFRPYVQMFVLKASEQGYALNGEAFTRLTMKFEAPQDDMVLGSCTTGSNGLVVRISPISWNAANMAKREQLVFHELGHCIMGLPHQDETVWATGYNPYVQYPVKVSLMSTYALGTIYELNRTVYIKQLFSSSFRAPMVYSGVSQFNIQEYAELAK